MNVLQLNSRHIAIVMSICMLGSTALFPDTAHAAGNARFELRPHCINKNAQGNDAAFGGPVPAFDQILNPTTGTTNTCPSFQVRTPDSVQTHILKNGDVLDLDLVLHNPDKRSVSRFRAWLMYDPSILQGSGVTINPLFGTPNPGEDTFTPNEGYIKLSGTANQPVTTEEIVVARITLKVTNVTAEAAPITFVDVSETNSRTGVFENNGANESNIITSNQGLLYVRFTESDGKTTLPGAASSSAKSADQVASQASQQSSTPLQAASSIATNSVFTMLQVQGARVTTEGSSVFLAWDDLPSAEIVGYNVYYGTTMGSYIQRRGVDKSATSITIRTLPVGTTYYFAVRGVNAAGKETDFSQEVAVSVGNPRTSTSPLNANSIPTNTPGTDGDIAGDTGVSSVLMIFLIISAITGTALAFRRQWSIRS